MAHYSSAQIIAAAKKLDPKITVQLAAGEYYFAKSIIFGLPNTKVDDYVRVAGFTTEPDGLAIDDEVMVETVELRTLGADDEGGIVTKNEAVLLFGHRLEKALVSMGHNVIRSSDGHF